MNRTAYLQQSSVNNNCMMHELYRSERQPVRYRTRSNLTCFHGVSMSCNIYIYRPKLRLVKIKRRQRPVALLQCTRQPCMRLCSIPTSSPSTPQCCSQLQRSGGVIKAVLYIISHTDRIDHITVASLTSQDS